MAERIKLKRGLIIEVNLDPTRGSETGKIRPCIMVTNNTYNEKFPIIEVVPITAGSEKKAQIRSQYGSVKLDHPGAPLKKGGTRTYSCVPLLKGDARGISEE